MGNKFKAFICAVLAIVLVFLGIVCLWTSINNSGFPTERAAIAAAALALPDGGYKLAQVYSVESNTDDTTVINMNVEETTTVPPRNEVTFDEAVFSEDASIYDGESHLPVVETQYSGGDLGFNDFFVKNSTNFSLDIEKYLSRPLGFDFERNSEIQVLIVHTHTSESYLTYDEGYYHESFYPRNDDPQRNMLRVGRAVKEGLEAQGIGVVQATEVHDNPAYNGAYDRSYDTIEKYIEMYPNIKVVLDLHRDSISYTGGGGKVKPTFTYNGEKCAQIMIMAGYDPDGYYDFPFWEDNLTFALKIQDTCEQMYPGMTRPLYFGNFAYNMNINPGSLLIEMGTDVNTLQEAVNTGKLLSNVLAKVLQTS